MLKKDLCERYPNAVPIRIRKQNTSALPDSFNNSLLLAPRSMTARELSASIRVKACLKKSEGFVMFVSGVLLSNSNITMSEIFDKYSQDGFLYIQCTDQASFGQH